MHLEDIKVINLLDDIEYLEDFLVRKKYIN